MAGLLGLDDDTLNLLGGMFSRGALGRGLLAYQQGKAQQEQLRLLEEYKRAQMEEMQRKEKEAQQKAADAQRKQDEFARFMTPGAGLGPLGAYMKPPSTADAAEYLARQGGDAKTLTELEKMRQPEFGLDLKEGVDARGNRVFAQSNKRGGAQVVPGIMPPAPKPEMQLVTRPDGTMEWVDKNAVGSGTSYKAAMTPYQQAQVAAQQAAASAERAKADAMRDVGGGQAQRELSNLVAKLRTEYNSLDAVKNYVAAAPLAESVKTTQDTPAGDLDFIYAVGKVLDPGSVVREGEMELVIKSGSPLERYKGDVRMIMQGKGRLTPRRRQELSAMMENRIGQLRAAKDRAAFPYVLQAKRNNLPAEEIFGQQPDGNLTPKEKQVVQTGVDKKTGRRVVKYADGSIEYDDAQK